jgi:hypothetical protein
LIQKFQLMRLHLDPSWPAKQLKPFFCGRLGCEQRKGI